MPKVKEPTPQYSPKSPSPAVELLMREIQGLPKEALAEVINFVRFLRTKLSSQKKKMKSLDSITAELRMLSRNEVQHLEEEFVNYRKLYPREK
jgi:hypothetical protein